METRTLGDYTIIKQIGQGALGTVYLAEHSFMKQQFMLKVLPEELVSDRQFIQRFEEEVALISTLDHPNIVKIHNVSHSQGRYFLVSNCVVDKMGETTNLAQYIASRDLQISEEEVLDILKQIASALDYAHSIQIAKSSCIHRGLKLNNILVGQEGNGLHVSLCDFGLTRIVGESSILTMTYRLVAEALGMSSGLFSSSTLQQRFPTQAADSEKQAILHNSFLQSFAFLAPEQKIGVEGQELSAKADVYAFGVLAYFLLFNHLPEGCFEMPSKEQFRWASGWENLLRLCMDPKAEKRTESLVTIVNAVQGQIQTEVNAVAPKRELACALAGAASTATPTPGPETPPAVGRGGAVQSHSSLKPVLNPQQIVRPTVDPDPASAFEIDSTVKTYVPKEQAHTPIEPLRTDMVVIKGGDFNRGSQAGNRDEMPPHRVILQSFAIDVHPVSNEQFVRFLEMMGGEKDQNHHDIIKLKESRIKRTGGKLSIESGYAKHPVVGVSWYGAAAYAKWLGKRLPTEAEWEAAARGGQENPLYPTGDEIEKSQANYFSSDTIAVMSYGTNSYGLYDIAGNVYEWCYDWYGYNFYEASAQEPDDPHGPLQGVYRVLRGGCWKSLKEDLRCSKRHRNNPGAANSTYGFRCAANVQ
jgi:formylglycine-generating enzyme required for sulfatase activity